MKASALGWTGSNVGGQHFPTRYIIAIDIANQPVMPLAVLGISTAWCIWVWEYGQREGKVATVV